MRDRIQEIDIAKGIGILLVVIGHATGIQQGGIIRNVIYVFHMPLFFFLSGLVLKQEPNEKRLLEDSDLKLLSNYLLYSVLFFGFDLIVRFIFLGMYDIATLGTEIIATITLYGISVLWFLSTLFVTKILLRTVLTYMGGKLYIFILFSYIVSMLGENIVNQVSIHGIWKLIYFPVATFFRVLMMFVFLSIGFLSKNVIKKFIECKFISCIGITIVLFFMTISLSSKCGSIDYRILMFGKNLLAFFTALLGIFGAFGISIIINKIGKCKKFFLFMGRHSLFVMATHEYFMIKNILSIVLKKLSLHGMTFTIAETVVLVAIECVLVYKVEPITERILKFVHNKIIYRMVNSG